MEKCACVEYVRNLKQCVCDWDNLLSCLCLIVSVYKNRCTNHSFSFLYSSNSFTMSYYGPIINKHSLSLLHYKITPVNPSIYKRHRFKSLCCCSWESMPFADLVWLQLNLRLWVIFKVRKIKKISCTLHPKITMHKHFSQSYSDTNWPKMVLMKVNKNWKKSWF